MALFTLCHKCLILNRATSVFNFVYFVSAEECPGENEVHSHYAIEFSNSTPSISMHHIVWFEKNY